MQKTVTQILEEMKILPRVSANYQRGKELIRDIGYIAVMAYYLHENGKEITRATKPFPGMSLLKHLSYRPADQIEKRQRGSIEKKTMFYGCTVNSDQPENLTRAISACESVELLRDQITKDIKTIGRQTVVYSKWVITEKLKLAALVYHPEYYKKGNTLFDEMYVNFNSMTDGIPNLTTAQKSDFKNINRFFANEFAKKEEDYFWSALYTEILCEQGYDGVLYPPVRTDGMLGMNLAITPDAANQKLKFRIGAECTIYKNKDITFIPVDRHVQVTSNLTLAYTNGSRCTLEERLQRVNCKSLDEIPEYKNGSV